MKKIISVFLSICIIFSVITVYANENTDAAISDTVSYLINLQPNPSVGSIGGEWLVIGIARSGEEAPQGYFERYYDNVCRYVSEKNGILHEKKYTEYSRLIIALTAIGKNPADVCGFNLLTALGDYEKVVWQGLNGPIFALIALDSRNYEMPVCADGKLAATRQMYVDCILSRQGDDGGFALADGGASDVDITAMALQALSRYTNDEKTKNAVSRALEFLSGVQNDRGGFSSGGSENAESCAQVLTALSALGIPADDSRFVKNGKTVLDALMSFYSPKNGFMHTKDKSGVSAMSSEQGLYALAAYRRMVRGENSLYNMTDVSAQQGGGESFGLSGKDERIKHVGIVHENKTFSDISENVYRKEIEELAKRNVVSGKGQDMFVPDDTMTRAEFAAITVNALGLDTDFEKIFEDVGQEAWYGSYIAAAYRAGIVNGVSDTLFEPEKTITRMEASAMVARAAAFCGMNTEIGEFAARDVLAVFDDAYDISAWAVGPFAFCIINGMIPDDEMTAEPMRFVTRCEIAHMVYTLMDKAKLL